MTTQNVVGGVWKPSEVRGMLAPVPTGDHVLIELKALACSWVRQVTKQGGSGDITFVILEIDGRNVINLS